MMQALNRLKFTFPLNFAKKEQESNGEHRSSASRVALHQKGKVTNSIGKFKFPSGKTKTKTKLRVESCKIYRPKSSSQPNIITRGRAERRCIVSYNFPKRENTARKSPKNKIRAKKLVITGSFCNNLALHPIKIPFSTEFRSNIFNMGFRTRPTSARTFG